MYIWLGRSAPSQLISALFGAPTLDGVDLNTLSLVEQGNDYSARICAIVNQLRQGIAMNQKLRIVKDGAGDLTDARFHWHLIEDRQNFPGGNVAYAEYLSIVLRESQMAQMPTNVGAAPGANPTA
jgi:hypothetical protein